MPRKKIMAYVYCAKSKDGGWLWGSISKNPTKVWFYLAARMRYPLSGSYMYRLKREGFQVVKVYLSENKYGENTC